jgi:DNA-binding beta-propeller fold protein YncE
MLPRDHFGIVVDNTNQWISIFDTKTLQTLQQIPLQADIFDVAITGDCRRAVVTSFNSRTMFQIDLCVCPARVTGSAVADTSLEDVALTPDGRFALSVDGSAANQAIVSYSLKKNAFVSSLPTDAQAVAVSPVTSELVLTAVFNNDSVRRFTLSRKGVLADTGQEIAAGPGPINVLFSPDGKFAFVADFFNGISVLSTSIPDKVTLIDNAPSFGAPQSMAVTRDGRYLFVLGFSTVDIYSFDAYVGSLTRLKSFEHGLDIVLFFGVDQIALSPDEKRLFISAIGQVGVFTTFGLPLGTVSGASGPGGIAICPCGRELPRIDKSIYMHDNTVDE